MKIKTLFLAAIFAFCANIINAQSLEHEKWFPVLISAHGTIDHYGVKANCKITKCNGEDVMLMELVNTNAYAVKCEWLHSPIDNEGKQHYVDALQTIELKANETKTGQCGETVQLIIKLSEYKIKAEAVSGYYGSNFNVIKK